MRRSPERHAPAESCPDQGVSHSQEVRPASLPAPLSGAEASRALLKAKIREIQSSPVLTPKQKAESVQNLMMKDWNDAKSKTGATKTEYDTEVERKRTSYHRIKQKVSWAAAITNENANCCASAAENGIHDDTEDHVFDRYASDTVSCMKCDTVQPIGQTCVNEDCKSEFGRYYCEVCRFIDDDDDKDIYHCDKCNICRVGKGLDIDYFHCGRCNACMSISIKTHKCVERSLESDCPICHAYMFTSTTPVMFLPCGHCMHVSCYEEYTLTNYICPLCSKSLGDMQLYFASIDEVLEREQMPAEYEDYISLIYCSDCERKSTTKFHFVYHKCQFEDCMSYNTKVLRQFKESEEQVEGS